MLGQDRRTRACVACGTRRTGGDRMRRPMAYFSDCDRLRRNRGIQNAACRLSGLEEPERGDGTPGGKGGKGFKKSTRGSNRSRGDAVDGLFAMLLEFWVACGGRVGKGSNSPSTRFVVAAVGRILPAAIKLPRAIVDFVRSWANVETEDPCADSREGWRFVRVGFRPRKSDGLNAIYSGGATWCIDEHRCDGSNAPSCPGT